MGSCTFGFPGFVTDILNEEWTKALSQFVDTRDWKVGKHG
jgi:hypothetical protein